MARRTYKLMRVSDGEQVELDLDEGWVLENMDVLRQFTYKGVQYQRVTGDEFTQVAKEKKIRTRARWPYRSTFAGVMPHQANQIRQHLKTMTGYDVDINRDGEILYTGPQQRREVLRAMGYYDRNAGYSDPVPNERLREQLGISPERGGFTG